MSSADVIDALFVRTVDIVQSLPKSGPIQTSYEEKLALYSLYKQATEGDVQSKRPGMLDMLGRAKWDAWAKVRGLPCRDAKQLYVESMLRTLRKFGDRPQAIALIEELEAFSGDVAQRVMEGSFANDETEGSSESSEEVHSAPQQAYLSRVSHQAARITSGKHASGTPPPPSAKRRSETAESSTSKLKNVGAQDRNQGLASTQPSRAPSVTGASLRGSSRGQPCGQDLGGSESEPSSDSDEFETRAPAFAPGPNRLSKVTGQGLRGHARPPSSSGSLYGRRYGGSASQANLNRPPSGMQSQKIGPKTDSTAHLPRLLSPPQSVEHLPISNRAARPSSVSGAGGGRQFYSSVQSPAPSQATFSNYRLLDGQASRNFHGASSAGGLSARATTHGDKRLMLESVGGDTLPRPDVDQALQSIQASLAALHERLNRVEGKSPRSRNGGGGLGSSHKGLFQGFFEALANALHDVSVLLGLSSPIPRAEGFAVPSFGSVGNSSRGSIVTGRAAAAAHLVTVPVQIFTIILKIAFRLALDVTSMVLLVCVFLFVFKRITGKGDPLFWLRIMRRWVRSRGARNSQVSS